MDSLQENNQNPDRPRPINKTDISEGTKPLCATRNLGKSFPGVRALQGVSLEFKRGKIHALMGENGAGKSTLLKCLFGIYFPDEGEILIDGVPVRLHGPRDAMAHGFAMVHQELHPIRDMSVMENLWLGRMPQNSFGFVDFRKMERESLRLFEEWQMELDPKQRVGDLSVSKIQSMEIAKAIFSGAKLLIMDEPTSSLSEKEVLSLYSTIDRLKSQGTAIVYISHKMDEIKRLADDISVMRDGQVVGTFEASQISRDQVISLMVGRELTKIFPEKSAPIAAQGESSIMLRVDHVSHRDPRSEDLRPTYGKGKVFLQDIHFSLKKGEILGVGGLVGSGRSELLKGLFGLMPFRTGAIFLDGQRLNLDSSERALKAGMGYLSEDRRQEGIFPQLSIVDNLMMSSQERYMKLPFWIDSTGRLEETQKAIKSFQIKTPSPLSHIVNLSGGNQQKVLLARALMTSPRVLLLDEPTRGIDVGAKHEIYLLIDEFVRRGGCVVVVSSELPELIGLAHRVLMLCDGRQAAILEGEDLTETRLMKAATLYH